MRLSRILAICSVVVLIEGCQTSPTWTHPSMQDQGSKAEKLKSDDAECSLLADQYGSGAPIVIQNEPKSFSGTAQTYNLQTGETTVSTYNGQLGGPSGGFAGGFAAGLGNGVAIGHAIRAAQMQDKAYRHCMTSRGWIDTSDKAAPTPQISVSKGASPLESPDPYPDAQTAWKGDVAEFMRFFPEYRSGAKFEAINERVKALARAKALEGPQYLIEALEAIEPEALRVQIRESEGVLERYVKAARGDARAQAGLGLAYVQNEDSRTPYDPARSTYWSRKSALAGNPVGQLGYGWLLFSGGVMGRPNHVAGYMWVKQAGKAGVDVESTLRQLEENMTRAELRQVGR